MKELTSKDIEWEHGDVCAVVENGVDTPRLRFSFEPEKIDMSGGETGFSFNGHAFNADFYYIVMRYKPEEKPVYTQAMFDNDRQPLPGMRAMVSVNGARTFECTVKCLGDVIVIEDTCPTDRAYQSAELTFTPIDTRTPKQMLIDKLSDEFEASPEFSQVSTNDYNEWDLRIALGMFIDNGYFGEIKS